MLRKFTAKQGRTWLYKKGEVNGQRVEGEMSVNGLILPSPEGDKIIL
jgi:hypothetical protein